MEECKTCEGMFGGQGYCKECGAFDTCYYRLCIDEPGQEGKAIHFARDMQENPHFKTLTAL